MKGLLDAFAFWVLGELLMLDVALGPDREVLAMLAT